MPNIAPKPSPSTPVSASLEKSDYLTTSINFRRPVLLAAREAAKARGYRSLSAFVDYEIGKVLGVGA